MITQFLKYFFSASDIIEAVRGPFHFYGINYKGCVIQVVLLRGCYLVAAATPNKYMVAMYQKLSFSEFILFYNSKNRHLELLNLSPQGLISSA